MTEYEFLRRMFTRLDDAHRAITSAEKLKPPYSLHKNGRAVIAKENAALLYADNHRLGIECAIKDYLELRKEFK